MRISNKIIRAVFEFWIFFFFLLCKLSLKYNVISLGKEATESLEVKCPKLHTRERKREWNSKSSHSPSKILSTLPPPLQYFFIHLE